MKKTKFNFKSDEKELLMTIALAGLKNKIDTLPQFEQKYEDRAAYTEEHKLEKYEGYIRKEIAMFEEIKFDGYMLLLQDMVNTARQMGIFISCFGSIQNSLTAYALGITDHYTFRGWNNFIHSTPFELKPTVNIVASSYRMNTMISYLTTKYKNLIKKFSYDKYIQFNDNLTLKFIDLGVDTEVRLHKKDVKKLGLKIVKPNLNISRIQAGISSKYTLSEEKLENVLFLGLEALQVGDTLVEAIIDAREDYGFKDFDDFLEKVPLLKHVDKSILKKLSKNKAFSKVEIIINDM
jgi:DNA polymerase III alpha subunit